VMITGRKRLTGLAAISDALGVTSATYQRLEERRDCRRFPRTPGRGHGCERLSGRPRRYRLERPRSLAAHPEHDGRRGRRYDSALSVDKPAKTGAGSIRRHCLQRFESSTRHTRENSPVTCGNRTRDDLVSGGRMRSDVGLCGGCADCVSALTRCRTPSPRLHEPQCADQLVRRPVTR
jgi:hypothetical protein